MQSKLNSFIKEQLLQSGYDLSYNDLDECQLDQLISFAEQVKVGLQVKGDQVVLSEVMSLYQDMKILISTAQEYGGFDKIWEGFWEISGKIAAIVPIDYYDTDTTYEADIMARFNAIKDYLQGAL